MDVLVSVAPIIILIVLMTKKNSWPSHMAMPVVAILVYAAKLVYFESDPNLINATVIDGLLSAWTPILITWGAIFMFKTMEASGSMDVVRAWLNVISDNRVAQLMIIGWAFAFLIEGASGFGTPAALAAPILVGLGFDPLRVAMLCLVMNTVPVSFGAVGTPTWFGMGELELQQSQLFAVSRYSALIHTAAALFIPLIALLFVLEWKEVRRNLGFLYLSIAGCVIPFAMLAHVNYEFPSLLGGMIGLLMSIVLARYGIGLSASARDQGTPPPSVDNAALVKATFPLWGSVLVLLVSRIPQLGIKGLLTDATPLAAVTLGTFGELSVSRALVLALRYIFGAESHWEFQTLYVPAFIPFFMIACISFVVFRLNASVARQLFTETSQRMVNPIMALLSALVMVKLLMVDGEQSMVINIGGFFASVTGTHWQYFAAYLGALGSFFSGSATISNLTFSGIQDSVAEQLNLNRTVILSLQSVGASMGNMVCINNIVAVCSILGIVNREGTILVRTLGPMMLYGIVAAVAGGIIVGIVAN